VVYDEHGLARPYRDAGRHDTRCDDQVERCALIIHAVQTADRGKYECFFARTQATQRHVFWLYVVGEIRTL